MEALEIALPLLLTHQIIFSLLETSKIRPVPFLIGQQINPVYICNFQSQAGKLQAKYDQAVKRLAVLEEQLDGVKTGKVRQLRFNACHYTQEATIT